MGGIGNGADNLSLITELFPQCAIIELSPKSLASGVVNILNVGKNGDAGHNVPPDYCRGLLDSAHYFCR
jgi:hypothetical protein